MSETPRSSAEHDYANDLELRQRILVRKIECLMEHDSDVRSARTELDSILNTLRSEANFMTGATISHAEMTIETMSFICDVPKGEFDRIAAQCYAEYRRELEAVPVPPAESARVQETRGLFGWLVGRLRFF